MSMSTRTVLLVLSILALLVFVTASSKSDADATSIHAPKASEEEVGAAIINGLSWIFPPAVWIVRPLLRQYPQLLDAFCSGGDYDITHTCHTVNSYFSKAQQYQGTWHTVQFVYTLLSFIPLLCLAVAAYIGYRLLLSNKASAASTPATEKSS